MKVLISILMVFCFLNSQGQHVGINKPNPSQPLDINGNLNIDGSILTNGVAGSPGQVLATSETGSTVWVNRSEFTRVAAFTQNSNFTVPSGVTRIMVEMWGAGGGGSSGGGGGAGMYILALVAVTPGQVFDITLGFGGAPATNGPNTVVSRASPPSITFTALGGNGASASNPGGTSSFSQSNSVMVQYPGEPGRANTVTYAQKNSTTFAVIRKYGDGGAAGPAYSIRGQGQTRIVTETNGSILEDNNPAPGPSPGGGGGGGATGDNGGRGMVVIWY